jgi:zinc resistance-associated protein
MWKAILAGTTALAIAGSSLVYAQQRSDRSDRSDGLRRWQPNVEDVRAFGEARLAGLHAGLGLNADQERNWPAFEQAAREFQKLRLDRLSAFASARRDGPQGAADPAERLRRRATAMSETGAVLKKLADATDPLYKSLDDNQKRRFAILSRMGGLRDGDRFQFRGRDDDRFQFRGRDGDPRDRFQFRDRDGGPRGFDRDGGPRGFDRDRRRTDFDRLDPRRPRDTVGGPISGEEDL